LTIRIKKSNLRIIKLFCKLEVKKKKEKSWVLANIMFSKVNKARKYWKAGMMYLFIYDNFITNVHLKKNKKLMSQNKNSGKQGDANKLLLLRSRLIYNLKGKKTVIKERSAVLQKSTHRTELLTLFLHR